MARKPYSKNILNVQVALFTRISECRYVEQIKFCFSCLFYYVLYTQVCVETYILLRLRREIAVERQSLIRFDCDQMLRIRIFIVSLSTVEFKHSQEMV